MKNKVHILLIEQEDYHQKLKANIFMDSSLAEIILDAKHFNRLEAICKIIPRETDVYLWIHLGQIDGNGAKGANLVNSLIKKFPVINNENIAFQSSQTKIEFIDTKVGKVKVIPFRKYEDEIKPIPHYWISKKQGELDKAKKDEKAIKAMSYDNGDHDIVNQLFFEKMMNEQAAKGILYEIFEGGYNNFVVKILTPGFSGAQVLQITCKKGNMEKNAIVKIDKNRDNLIREINTKKDAEFTGVIEGLIFPKNESLKQYKDWSYLTYDVATGKQPLKKYLQTVTIQDAENSTATVLDVLAEMLKSGLNHSVKSLRSNPWASKSDEILKIQKEKASILHELNIFKKYYFFNDPKGLIHLGDFLEITFPNSLLSQFPQNTPIGWVHGDFHTSNILVDKTGEKPSIIDFALSGNNQHLLLDFGKLSVDTELALINDQLLVLVPNAIVFINQWTACHKNWLKKELNFTFEKNETFNSSQEIFGPANKVLEKAYRLNQKIYQAAKKFSKDKLPEEKFSEQDILHHFLLVRLHYFLKTISYTNILLEKRMFAAKASIHMLKYFEDLANKKV